MQNWSTTIVTPLSYDTEPTVLITFDNAKYMFNVGENTNRAFYQSRKNWKRMRGIFLTQVRTQRASGLGGMLMSFADASIDKLDVVGPPGLRHYLASMRMYLYRSDPATPIDEIRLIDVRKQLDVSTREFLPERDASAPEIAYQDNNIIVYSFPISRLPAFPNYEVPAENFLEPDRKRKRVDDGDRSSKLPKLEDEIAPETSSHDYREGAIRCMFKQCAENSAGTPRDGDVPIPDEYQRKNIPSWFYKQLPPFSFPSAFPQSSTLAYIVVGPRIRGRIDGKKLTELGVPFNALRGKLTRGETIQFEVNGPQGPEIRAVRPEDCMNKSDPPAAVIILDVPSVDMIPSVARSFDTVYKPFHSPGPHDSEQHAVRVVYHLLGPGVLEDARYIKFLNGFPETVEHVVSSPEHSPNPVTFTSHGFNQYRLSYLDPEAFPLPQFNSSPQKHLTSVASLPKNTHVLSANLTIPLRPPGPPRLDSSAPDDRFHSSFTQPQSLPETTSLAFDKAKKALSRHPVVPDQHLTGVTILPLGTGSAIPNKYRNVSSTLIRTPSGCILLDSGEGTIGQLTRRFGRGTRNNNVDVNDILADLKCIFVSHVHADHHMGLAKLLRQRKLLPNTPKHPLYIVSIRPVHLYLKEYQSLEDIGLCDDPHENGVVQVLSDALNFKYDEYPKVGMWRVGGDEPWLDLQLSRKHARDMCHHLDLEVFKAIDVYHRTKAFGVYFKHKDGWSIAFSGDTIPIQNLPKVASGATLLIHEATMGDDQEELAKTKSHSTVGQAIQIARDMNAKNVLLTHFSARYPKMPPSVVVSPEETTSKRKEPLVTLAFDLMEMDLDNMWKANLYLPAIEQCFKDSAEEGDEDLHTAVEGSLNG